VALLKFCNKGALTIGQPTAGAAGVKNVYLLPGGIQIQWTGTQSTFSDGSQSHAKGIQPDIFVEKKISDVIQGKDSYIQKALQVIKEK
jgi:C-terminal processing protease CtpA/Prc